MTALEPGHLDRLRRFLVDHGEPVAGPLSAELITGGRSNLTYRLDDGIRSWALRRPPTGGVISSAHDVVREYRVVAALQGSGVPVAPAVGCEESQDLIGAPFAVVGYVAGRTVRTRDDVADWTDADFAGCADGLVGALVGLHAVDPVDVGLGDFGRHDGYAARQLRRWSGQWQAMDAVDPRADRLLGLLTDRIPDQERTSVVHGDYRVDNVILDEADPGRVRAILDWELSTLGDPVADVALMCVYRHPALDGVLGVPAAWTSEGFPSGENLRSSYEELASASLSDWDFHLALAYYKLAVIAQGIAYRHRLGVTAGDRYEGVAATVPVLLEAGLERAARHV